MSDVPACRVCLSTDLKLLHIFKQSYIAQYLENITGSTITPSDDLPQYLCLYCCGALRRCERFRFSCLRAQHALTEALGTQQLMTTVTYRYLYQQNPELRSHHPTVQNPTVHYFTVHNSTGHNSTGQNSTGQNSTGQNSTGHNSTGQNSTVQNNNSTGQNSTGQKSAVHSSSSHSSTGHNSTGENSTGYKSTGRFSTVHFSTSSKDTELTLEPGIKIESLCKRELLEFRLNEDSIKTELEEHADVGSPAANASDDDTPLLHLKQLKQRNKQRKRKRNSNSNSNGNGNSNGKRVTSRKLRFPEDDNIDVIELSLEEQIAEVQARRSSLNYLSSPFKCPHCFKGFLQQATFRNHMELHHPRSGAHTCPVCQCRYASPRRLAGHARVAHQTKYVCRLCRHTANSCYQARLHQKWHRGVTYDCNICGKSFSKVTSQLTHLRLRHAAQSAARCGWCARAFLSAHGLAAHTCRERTRTQISGQSSDSVPDPSLHCSSCNLQFDTTQALALHDKTSSRHNDDVSDMDRHCTVCGQSFATDDQLRKHRSGHRTGEKCTQCGVVCASARSLSAHYRRAHVAHAAHSAAASGDSAAARLRAGGGAAAARNYVCELCGTKCASLATLGYHQRVHSGEKPFRCTHCDRRFRLDQHLQIHVRRHTGERPFACASCPKAFVHKAALNRHARVHSGAKPYPCGHCGKTFSQSNSVKVHVNSVHLKLPQRARVRRSDKTRAPRDVSDTSPAERLHH